MSVKSGKALKRCVVASSNRGKLRELGVMLEPLGVTPVAQGELNIDPAPEPHCTFIENCLAKARHASKASGLPALADDSGVCVPALGGAPGVYSARYAQRAGVHTGDAADAANNAHLVSELSQLAAASPEGDPFAAYYYCVLVWLERWDDPQPVIADARWQGRIIAEPRGSSGFGYDPHFLLPDIGLTAAQLPPDEKNAISHRGQAMRLLQSQLLSLRSG
ncbi:MAG: non-canonical purine NTP pyrophosphatase [Burkholderiaceae bacterium]